MSSQFRTIPNPDFTRRPVLPPSNYQNHGRLPANGADQRLQKKESFIDAVQEKLGSGVTVKESMSGDIDLLRSSPHSTTSLPYALGGSATHVQVEVASWLAGFQDPIKALLGVGVHRDAKIIIKRKYIQGGGAMITPERAPARLVSVQEDVREVMLTRYGGDVECNLNHFLLPVDAQDEFQMKVDHQKRELERKLVNIGYETIMREGTMLPDAIVRSNPSVTNSEEASSAAERITTRMLFGCCAKYPFPVQNILAACKYASAYSVSGRRGSLLILPHGLPELLRYTKPERMKYEISGLTQTQTGKPIDMEIDNVVVDPTTGVRIMTHVPQPTFNCGAVLEPEASPLQNKVTIRMFYDVVPDESKLLDFKTGALRTVTTRDICDIQGGGPIVYGANPNKKQKKQKGAAPAADDTAAAAADGKGGGAPKDGTAAGIVVHNLDDDAADNALLGVVDTTDKDAVTNPVDLTEENIDASFSKLPKMSFKTFREWAEKLTADDEGFDFGNSSFYDEMKTPDQIIDVYNPLMALMKHVIDIMTNFFVKAIEPEEIKELAVWKRAQDLFVEVLKQIEAVTTEFGLARKKYEHAIQANAEATATINGDDGTDAEALKVAKAKLDESATEISDLSPKLMNLFRACVDLNAKLLYETHFAYKGVRGQIDAAASPPRLNAGDGTVNNALPYVTVPPPGDGTVNNAPLIGTPPFAPPGDGTVNNAPPIGTSPPGGGTVKQTVRIIRTVEFMMSSAILGVPGSQTGELLFAYPMTGISTNIASESMLMKLRVYLGAALYQPEDILIIPDVAFEGITDGSKWICNENWTRVSGHKTKVSKSYYVEDAGTWRDKENESPDRFTFSNAEFQDAYIKTPTPVYQGAVYGADERQTVTNCGHLHDLESPSGWVKFWGSCGGNVYGGKAL